MVADIKAYQGIVSNPVAHFDYLKLYHLKKYHDKTAPVIVFGIYDFEILKVHKGLIILHWCGNDARIQSNRYDILKADNIINVTPLPKVKQYMKARGVKCHLIKVVTMEKVNPLQRGDKVYAYINHYKKEYHGNNIILRLRFDQKLLVGDFTVPTKDWVNGVSDSYYRQCFIGLFLSDYCGGGMGIIEMGLRGIRVVTNVFDFPHTIHWNTVEDIQYAIEHEAANIGKSNSGLANEVANRIVLSENIKEFDLDYLLM